MNELCERELQNTSINDVSLADYVKKNYVSMSVIEDIKTEIDEIAQGHNPTHDPFDGGYTVAIMDVLNIIDKHCGKENE